MDLPDLVASTLSSEESVLTHVPLGGDDALLITDQRSLLYRAEGLLSEESVEEIPHDAERLTVSEGRRNAKISLDYGLDGDRTIKLPVKRLDAALKPLLAGVLEAAGVIDDDETVTHVFRFSDLTLVITSDRVVKHIGGPVWDDDYEQYHYDDVTDLSFEEGSVATAVVLTLGNRQERFKAPNEQAREVREGLESVLLSSAGVESLEELRVRRADDDDGTEAPDRVDFGAGPDPLATTAESDDGSDGDGSGQPAAGSATAGGDRPANAGDPEDGVDRVARADSASSSADGQSVHADPQTGDEQFAGSGFHAAGTEESELATEVRALREAVDQQGQQLREQRELIETLIEELRHGR